MNKYFCKKIDNFFRENGLWLLIFLIISGVYILISLKFNMDKSEILTVYIALCALFSTIWINTQNRIHNKLSVKPKLKFLSGISSQILPDKENVITYCINIINVGFGPAILVNFKFLVNENVVDFTNDKPVHEALKLLFADNFEDLKINYYTQLREGSVIGINDKIELLNVSISTNIIKSEKEFKAIINKFKSSNILYKSLYNEQDTLNITDFK